MTIDAPEYRLLQQSPRVFRRSELSSTCRLLGEAWPGISASISRILEGEPIAKPLQHTGGPDTDLFDVAVPLLEARQVCGHLLSREAAAVSPDGDTTALASTISSLLDRWTRYVRSLEQGAA
jgi:hypothetical protein